MRLEALGRKFVFSPPMPSSKTTGRRRGHNPEVAGSKCCPASGPLDELSSHPRFVRTRLGVQLVRESHLGACLSDLVRKFPHVSGVRTQWPSAESRREFGLGADDCVSSVPVVSERRRETLASGRERERSVWSRAHADTTLLIHKEVSGILG